LRGGFPTILNLFFTLVIWILLAFSFLFFLRGKQELRASGFIFRFDCKGRLYLWKGLNQIRRRSSCDWSSILLFTEWMLLRLLLWILQKRRHYICWGIELISWLNALIQTIVQVDVLVWLIEWKELLRLDKWERLRAGDIIVIW